MNKMLLLLVAILSMSCFNKLKSNSNDEVSPKVDSILAIIEVPKKLKEISDICFINDSLVAAVADEKGVLYFFDLNKKEIVKEYVFADDGDYEDLARKGDDMYVVRSDGRIYEIINFNSKNPQVKHYDTPLKSKNDIEGLAYDVKNDRLMLSVKTKNLKKQDKEKDIKNIYQFTLKDKKFHEDPAMGIHLKDVEKQFKGDELLEASKNFLKAVGNKNLSEVINPSALCYHPISGKLYVLSSINNFILVLNPDGTFFKLSQFKGKEFIQPEGIGFNSKGEIFVSNEGKDKKGNIIKITE